jgi:hypothetical protein
VNGNHVCVNSMVEQELLTLPGLLSSPLAFVLLIIYFSV